MDMLDKAGQAVGDVLTRARERERLRIADRIGLIELIDGSAREVVRLLKHRPGYSWLVNAEEPRLRAISAAEAINDDELRAAVDRLAAIRAEYSTEDDPKPAPAAELEAAYRALVVRLGHLRRATFEGD